MKKSSEKSFGILFFFFFLIVGFFPLINHGSIRIWSIVIGILFLLVSFFEPILLKPFNILWIKFGELLGRVVSPIVMLFIFFVVVTPLSLLAKLFGQDMLSLKLKKEQKSYWIKRKNNITSMKKQY